MAEKTMVSHLIEDHDIPIGLVWLNFVAQHDYAHTHPCDHTHEEAV